MSIDRKIRAHFWTEAQYVLLVILVVGGRIFSTSVEGWALIAAAFLLAGWAFLVFRKTRLRITPMVAGGSRLITSGPYRWIRHPMYASVLLAAIGAVFLDPTFFRMGAALLLVPVIYSKLTVEEELLRDAYPDYAEYASRTHRLIPFVW